MRGGKLGVSSAAAAGRWRQLLHFDTIANREEANDTSTPMPTEDFWKLIESHLQPNQGEFDVAPLTEALSQKSPEEIVAFDRAFTKVYLESYGWPLWGAAYVINGGCSDDGFDYFRAWLIANGRAVYEAALRDPDSLADVAIGECEFEDFLYAAREAYERATSGEELTETYAKYPALGESWDFDDETEMRKRYPRLCEKFF